MRVTPDNIQDLKENEIFVFGSNDKGHHYGGAAKVAHEKFGAEIGNGRGIQGSSYAIVSMDGIEVIQEDISEFKEFARRNREFIFYVTEIGCGIAGYTPEQIAPLFLEASKLKNVYLPSRFWDVLNQE